MTHASNKPQAAVARETAFVCRRYDELVEALWRGREGCTVRCVPWRRTMMARRGDAVLYAKRFAGHRRSAAAEWRWLQRLPTLGIDTAAPIAWLAEGRSSMVVQRAVPGRSLDAWAVDAAREGWLAELLAFAVPAVAALAARLHGHGIVHRDLNCAHLFCTDPRAATGLHLIDVERAFRPRWRLARWIVKDLASLLASVPVALPMATGVRFLKAYAPQMSRRERRRLAAAVAGKARRIAGHRPRFG